MTDPRNVWLRMAGSTVLFSQPDLLCQAWPGGVYTGKEAIGRLRPEGVLRPRPPAELLDFIRAPEARTLLLTGAPGVGKTTLALSLLAAVERPCYYISTRVGRGNLLQHFPWLVGAVPSDHLIDLEDVRPPGERQEELIHLSDRLTDTIDPLSAGRRLREFLNLPAGLARRLGEPPSKAEPLLLFIDSWEGMIEPYVHLLGLDELGRSNLEHGLLSLFHAAGAGLVLAAESEHPGAMEYLSDGVVHLCQDLIDGGVARHLTVRKLRGAPVRRPQSAYTLQGATFTCLRASLKRGGPPELLGAGTGPAGPERGLSFGIPGLDESVGPVLPGDTLLAEQDEGGSSVPLAFLLVPLWTRALRNGWNITFLSDLAHAPRFTEELLTHLLPDVPLEGRLQFLPRALGGDPQAIWEDLGEALQPRHAVDISLRSLGLLLGEPTSALLPRISRLQLQAQRSQSALVLVVGSQDPLLPALATLVPHHVALRHYHGTYLLSGRFPHSASVGLLIEDEPPGPPRTLYIPMA